MLHLAGRQAVAARLKTAGLPGTVEAAEDLLLDGPLPFGLAFESDWHFRGAWLQEHLGLDGADWARQFGHRVALLDAAAQEQDEIVLWHDADLWCQVHLAWCLNLLHRAAGPALVSLAMLGRADGEALQARWQERQDVDAEGLRAGAAWWSGFASGQPALVQALAGHGSYPGALTEAAGWHLQRFPGRFDGLTGPERALLGLLDGDPAPFPDLLARWRDAPLGRALGLADRQVAAILRDLSRDEALVHVVNPADGDLEGLEDVAGWVVTKVPDRLPRVERPRPELWVGSHRWTGEWWFDPGTGGLFEGQPAG